MSQDKDTVPEHGRLTPNLHMPLRPRVEPRDMGHPVHIEELMGGLKAGNTDDLDNATDDALISSRQYYKQWTDGEIARLKDEYLRCYNAIVAELAKRGLTGG